MFVFQSLCRILIALGPFADSTRSFSFVEEIMQWLIGDYDNFVSFEVVSKLS
jgi:hypothetical protein